MTRRDDERQKKTNCPHDLSLLLAFRRGTVVYNLTAITRTANCFPYQLTDVVRHAQAVLKSLQIRNPPVPRGRAIMLTDKIALQIATTALAAGISKTGMWQSSRSRPAAIRSDGPELSLHMRRIFSSAGMISDASSRCPDPAR